MRCENIFCIYWVAHSCRLDEISLDVQGNCENCVYIDIDESILYTERRRGYEKYDFENEYNNG